MFVCFHVLLGGLLWCGGLLWLVVSAFVYRRDLMCIQGLELDGSFRSGDFSELMKQLSGRYSLQCACLKAYWGVKIRFYTFLTSALGGREFSASRFLCFTSVKKCSNPGGNRNNIPQTSSLLSGHYTDSANLVSTFHKVFGRMKSLG